MIPSLSDLFLVRRRRLELEFESPMDLFCMSGLSVALSLFLSREFCFRSAKNSASTLRSSSRMPCFMGALAFAGFLSPPSFESLRVAASGWVWLWICWSMADLCPDSPPWSVSTLNRLLSIDSLLLSMEFCKPSLSI